MQKTIKRKQINKKTKILILKKSNYHCYYCGRDLHKLPPYNITIDHIVHIYRGGTNDMDNLVACCRSCNSARGGLSALEFLEKRREEKREKMRQLGKIGGVRNRDKGADFSALAKKSWQNR